MAGERLAAGARSRATMLFLLACATSPSDAAAQEPTVRLFETADRCIGCHTGVVAPSGEDVSIGPDWRASMMANSARDPYWQAAVRREIMDRPAAQSVIEEECSICHMPMARTEAHVTGRPVRIFDHLPAHGGTDRLDVLAADGVSCSLCHQIRSDRLGTPASFVGGFVIDTVTPFEHRAVFGPFDVDRGRATIMHSATGFLPEAASHIQQSELCATCHTLITHALDTEGRVIGRLPEQVPYAEWRHSAFVEERSCQTCHMPVVEDSVPVTGVLGVRRADVSRHSFRGGNTFMLRMLSRYRDELAVVATATELELAANRTERHLAESTAAVSIEDAGLVEGRLEFVVAVRNDAGHKLPTAYPSRRVWLHVAVRDEGGRTLFESGRLGADGRIEGNDADADATRFERHYTRIERADEVQIYEAILGAADGSVTTGLLAATEYLKDNRLLPRGFDKHTAEPDIAVHGAAREDADFTGGGDRIRYSVDAAFPPGPLRVSVVLRFQPIAWRWARNLAEYDAPETNRFVAWFDAMADVSSSILARAEAVVR